MQQWVLVWIAVHGLLACTVKRAIEAPSLRDSSSLAGAPWGVPAGTAGEDAPVTAGTGGIGGAPNIDSGVEGASGASGGETGTGGASGATGTSGGTNADASVPPADAGDEPDAVADNGPELAHSFGNIGLQPGEELTGLCQSWAVSNAEPLFVNRVRAINDGGFDRSSWVWVDEWAYPAAGDTWPCAEFGFDHVFGNGARGVFFAHSTRSQDDVQAFPEGIAIEIPPNATIIGKVDLSNASDTRLLTWMTLLIDTLPESEVRVKLRPMAFSNTALDIAPNGDSRAIMQCVTTDTELDVHYVLPHFRSMGTALHLDVIGGPQDGVRLFSSTGGYGGPLGQLFAPPLRVFGAAGLSITCEYHNESGSSLAYGADQEMCVALLYATGRGGGGVGVQPLRTEDIDGVHETQALCLSTAIP